MYVVNEGRVTPSEVQKLRGMQGMVIKEAFKRFEALEHDTVNGFYDKELDMYFKDLNDWFKATGYTWSNVSPQ